MTLDILINLRDATIEVWEHIPGSFTHGDREMVWTWAPGQPIPITKDSILEALLNQLLRDHWMAKVNEGDFDEVIGPDGLSRWVSRPEAF